MQPYLRSLVRRSTISYPPVLIQHRTLRLLTDSNEPKRPKDTPTPTPAPTAPPTPTPHDEFLTRLTKWSSHLVNDTFVDVQISKHLPLQVQSSLLCSTTHPKKARISISWPPVEELLQPEFLAQPSLDLKEFPQSASLVFIFWLYNRRLPSPKADFSLEKSDRASQEHLNDLLTDSYLLGAALNSPEFQNKVLRTLASNLHKEEVEAARSAFPQYSSAIGWARKTWDKANGTAEGRRLADFAVDVAARRVFVVGKKGLVLNTKERRDLGDQSGFAGEVFASVGGQIGVRGVGIKDLGRVGEVDEG